ncbi:unnamed protein product [Rotaria sordida]|uniref:Uncharacterized protein n=1 Tax=Rotaria sordida TaxID=392033 RepID=A0A819MRY4_9BILA|nr:unnamed protein product [Rotaria sordida]
MLTGLADILRGAGLNVVEVAGWKTRGHGMMSSVKVHINLNSVNSETKNESIDFLIENSEDWDSSMINDDDDIGKRLLNI